jgi:hypothetical protein
MSADGNAGVVNIDNLVAASISLDGASNNSGWLAATCLSKEPSAKRRKE